MKPTLKQIVIVVFTILTCLTISCNTITNKKRSHIENKDTVQDKKNDYELANEFLLKLRKEKADTIIFYKRTCINCCDFFNIFWTAKGKKFLNKFYFDFTDMKTHSVSVELIKEKIFDELGGNYSVLKTSTIKENEHKLKNGNTILTSVDHYCYSQISIFTAADSIITDRMVDHSFEKFAAFNQNERGQTNDNYLENVNSKWNSFLKIIEEQLKDMSETKQKELETFRTQKIAD